MEHSTANWAANGALLPPGSMKAQREAPPRDGAAPEQQVRGWASACRPAALSCAALDGSTASSEHSGAPQGAVASVERRPGSRPAGAGAGPPCCPPLSPLQPISEAEAEPAPPGCLPPALDAGTMRPPPPKCAPLSGSLATSSQRDVLTAGHSKLLLSSEAATEERDEYLMRLLRKGAPPAGVPLAPPPVQAPQGAPPPVLQQQATQAQSQQAAEAPRFRAPGPVSRSVPPSVPAPASATPPASSPSRLLPRATSTTLASPSSTAGAGTGMGGATVPSLPLPTPSATATTTDQAVPTSAGGTAAGTPTAPPPRAAPLLPPHARAAAAGAPAAAPLAVPQLVAVPPDLAATFDQTRRMLGDEIALSVRDTMIRWVLRA